MRGKATKAQRELQHAEEAARQRSEDDLEKSRKGWLYRELSQKLRAAMANSAGAAPDEPDESS